MIHLASCPARARSFAASLVLLGAITGCGSNTIESGTDGPPRGPLASNVGSQIGERQPADPGVAQGDGGARGAGSSTRQAAITAGAEHTCALANGGGVKCWGWNHDGQLGNGSTTDSHTAVSVSGLSSAVTAVSARNFHTCALTASGGVVCWGANSSGQLGNGSTTSSSVPVAVSGLSSGVVAIAAGGSHTCALTSVGGVKCWGRNGFGELGDGTGVDSLVPVDVIGLPAGIVAITAGFDHTCALTGGGGVMCWGFDDDGELGHLPTGDAYAPVDVSDLSSGVLGIAAGAQHTCAWTTSGGVKCWGWNHFAQLGTDTRDAGYEPASFEPLDVPGLASRATTIAAGYAQTCAMTRDGGVTCWGLGGMAQVPGLAGSAAIAAGSGHTCALLADGGVVCMGDNHVGELGDGSTTDSDVPVRVVGF